MIIPVYILAALFTVNRAKLRLSIVRCRIYRELTHGAMIIPVYILAALFTVNRAKWRFSIVRCRIYRLSYSVYTDRQLKEV